MCPNTSSSSGKPWSKRIPQRKEFCSESTAPFSRKVFLPWLKRTWTSGVFWRGGIPMSWWNGILWVWPITFWSCIIKYKQADWESIWLSRLLHSVSISENSALFERQAMPLRVSALFFTFLPIFPQPRAKKESCLSWFSQIILRQPLLVLRKTGIRMTACVLPASAMAWGDSDKATW